MRKAPRLRRRVLALTRRARRAPKGVVSIAGSATSAATSHATPLSLRAACEAAAVVETATTAATAVPAADGWATE